MNIYHPHQSRGLRPKQVTVFIEHCADCGKPANSRYVEIAIALGKYGAQGGRTLPVCSLCWAVRMT